jgi:hypothetical protein
MSYPVANPTFAKGERTIFNYVGERATGALGFQPYSVPSWAQMLFIIAIGGAGGGGGGGSVALGTQTNGGSPGGPGGTGVLYIPTAVIPSLLYVSVGRGGAGGAAASNGVAGQTSFVSMQPTNSVVFMLLEASAGQGGLAAGTAATQTLASSPRPIGVVGTFGQSQPSGNPLGGTGAVGPNVNPQNSGSAAGSAGCGGGGQNTTTDFNGGGYNSGVLPTGGGGGGVAPGGAGRDGTGFFVPMLRPLAFYGGAGGASNRSGTGGAGGRGEIASGGGGGGGGTTGGAGGNGGDGLVIIVAH